MSASQNKVVQYFFAPHSPWTYLGHARLMAIAAKTGAQIDVRPFDLGKVFSVSGACRWPSARRSARPTAWPNWRAGRPFCKCH